MSMNQFTLSLFFSTEKGFIVSPMNHFRLWSNFVVFLWRCTNTRLVCYKAGVFQEIHKSRGLVFKLCFTMITSLKLNVINSSWWTNTGYRVNGFYVRGVFGKGFVCRKGGRNVTASFLINKTSISYSNRSSTTYIYNAPRFVVYYFKNIFHTYWAQIIIATKIIIMSPYVTTSYISGHLTM